MSLKTTKVFSRVNKQGKVIRIIREHYLRDDICCNSKECFGSESSCKHTVTPVLDAVIDSKSPYVVHGGGDSSNSGSGSSNKKKKKKTTEINYKLGGAVESSSSGGGGGGHVKQETTASIVAASQDPSSVVVPSKKKQKKLFNADFPALQASSSSTSGGAVKSTTVVPSPQTNKVAAQKTKESTKKTTLNDESGGTKEKKNDQTAEKSSSSVAGPIVHYVIPTVDLVLNYIEMFEVNQFSNIIFCETVLVEAQNQTNQKRLPHRIRAIVDDTALRKSILYCNEHSKDTYVERNETESPKERDYRAVATVAEWYRSHLNHRVPIVLLTLNEKESEQFKDIREGVIVMSIEEYINNPMYCSQVSLKADMKNLYVSLTDAMLRRLESDSTNLYEEYLPQDVLETGIKNRLFFRGVIHVSKNNPQEAHVKSSIKGLNEEESFMDQILISGHPDRNRAVHGDIVAVQLLPESEWIKDEATKVTKPKGRVVGVLQRNWRDYVVSLQVVEEDRSTSSDKYSLCIPLDYRIPKIRIMTRQRNVLEPCRIVVRINSWESNSTYPNGFYVRTLGPIGDLNVETEGLLIENGLDQIFKFSNQALNELPTHTEENPYQISSKEISLRRDIRKTHMVASIDPIGCEDIDDALSVKFLPNSNIEIGVHIADVSHYVKHESNLDLEARARSTTIYLVDRRLDMLPSLLSADLCSLRMGVDRLAVSVFWEFKRTGEVVNTWFGRTIIRSRYALHYAQAQNIINGVKAPPVPPTPGVNWEEAEVPEEELPELRKNLTALQQVARLIHKKRTSAGAVELESLDEVKIKLDASKEVKEIETKQDLEIHHTVAEWMIFANSAVAKKIYDCYPRSAVLRRHPLPKMENFKGLIQAAETRGFTMRTDTNHSLAESLEKAVDANDPYVNLLLRALATKAMEEAVYFSTGSFEPNEFLHYGLALEFYTHFTSPIRRYADILAHRMLLMAIEQEKNSQQYQQLMEHKKLAQICDHMNERHRASKLVESESSEWFRALYIKKKEDLVEDAIIFNVKSDALFVFVPAYRIKSIIHLTTKDGDLIVPMKEQKEYKVLENEPLGSQSSNPSILFDSEFNEKKLRLSVHVTRKDRNKTIKSEHSFKLFDHVKVHLCTNESRAHLPRVQVELTAFETSKSASDSSSKNVKNQLKEYSQQVLQEALEQEHEYKLQDTGYEQSSGNIQNMLANMRTQHVVVSTPVTSNAAPSSASSKYSDEELQKKLKAVNSRLKQIEKIKQKLASNVEITDEEKEKLASESKYMAHLKKLQKLCPGDH